MKESVDLNWNFFRGKTIETIKLNLLMFVPDIFISDKIEQTFSKKFLRKKHFHLSNEILF